MGFLQIEDCSSCPSIADCGATAFRPAGTAFCQLQDFTHAVLPGGGATCISGIPHSNFALRKAAARIAAGRRQRAQTLPGDLLGEPAWDILLELFAHALPLSVKSIGLGAGVPLTTTLRWISLLEQQDLLEQYTDPTDARRTLVRLTRDGSARVAKAVTAIRLAVVDQHEGF